jgi:hypothetical protein
LTYYAVLYFHYLLGGLFFSFLGLGLLRNVIWKGAAGGNRQLIFLLAYSVLIASGIAVFLTHRFSPVQEENDGGGGGSTRQLEGPRDDVGVEGVAATSSVMEEDKP